MNGIGIKMDATILFRPGFNEENELNVCKQYFNVVTSRSKIPAGNVIIGRYSVLPYYNEFQEDCYNQMSVPINTFKEHKYIADFDYYKDIEDLTFPTYFDSYNLPEGKYVVKGVTNSRKQQWDTHMFATNKRRAIEIMCELKNDSLIGEQDIIFREYIPLQTFGTGVNGIRFTNEWRCFYLGNKMVSFVYYWSNSFPKENISDFKYYVEMFLFDGGFELADEAADIISKKTNFFVLDIARAENGNWYVVEVNDGQMSGLNNTNKHSFYKELKERVKEFYEQKC